MSSATHIARTRFQTLGMDGAVLYTTYGARVYDDHESAYVNQLDSLDELMALDPDELIDHIRDRRRRHHRHGKILQRSALRRRRVAQRRGRGG